MANAAKVTVTALGLGRGNVVNIGDFVVPRRASWTWAGANGEPDAEAIFEVRDGRPQCVEFHVTAKPEGRQVFTSDLQVIGLDALTTSVYTGLALRQVFDPERNVTTTSPITDERELWLAVAAVQNSVKVPKRRVTAAELRRVAEVYRENVDGAPVKAVQTYLGYDSERTAARRVQEARRKGLLPKTTPGKRQA